MTSLLCMFYSYEHSGSAVPGRTSFLPATHSVALFSKMVCLRGIASLLQMSSCHLPQSFAAMPLHAASLQVASKRIPCFFFFFWAIRTEVYLSWTSAGVAYRECFVHLTHCIALFLNAFKQRFLQVSPLMRQVYLLFSLAPVLPSVPSCVQNYISFQSSIFFLLLSLRLSCSHCCSTVRV